ncbi:MAG TPA: hypothetical protein VGN65_13980 [Casimicrobiaceae bacterium]|jgi:Meckel syndrome type 1 protein
MNPDREPFDPTLDALLHKHSDEMPSPDIDAAILAAAHRAVQSAPRAADKAGEATRPWRWWMPLAAAATIGAITIGVFQLMPKESEPTASVVSDTPSSAAGVSAPNIAPPPAASMNKDKAEAPRAQTEAPRVQTQAPRAQIEASRAKGHADRVAPTQTPKPNNESVAAPEPFPARERDAAAAREFGGAAPSRVESESSSESAGQDNAAGALERRDVPRAAAPAVSKQIAAADAQVASPEQWIARIRAMLNERKTDEAARELTAFRAVYPDADARLPTELQAWAATVKTGLTGSPPPMPDK